MRSLWVGHRSCSHRLLCCLGLCIWCSLHLGQALTAYSFVYSSSVLCKKSTQSDNINIFFDKMSSSNANNSWILPEGRYHCGNGRSVRFASVWADSHVDVGLHSPAHRPLFDSLSPVPMMCGLIEVSGISVLINIFAHYLFGSQVGSAVEFASPHEVHITKNLLR